ncbi:MAG: transposase [Crocinitomicaceae bacterium]|nr:transposase [Crocinitomicaceae bacterium]
MHLYKYRWKVELFFKKLKQNFPLKYFVGDNQNAVEIQIWCALIALLLLSAIHYQHRSKVAFSVFVTVLRLHLFNYISLASLLNTYQRQRKNISPLPNQFSSA